MHIFKRLSILITLTACTSVTLSGCSSEKAEALLTATEAFRVEANKAISAYEELLLAALEKPTLSELEAIDSIITAANDSSSRGKELEFDVLTIELQDPFADAKMEIQSLVTRQKALYNAFSNSLTNLPLGSFFAAEEVACSAIIARKLVINISNYQEAIGNRQVDLVVPEEDAVIAIENAIESGTQIELREAARNVYEVFKRKNTLNQAVISQATIAASTRLKVIEVAENYDDFSLSDILTLTREAFTIAGTLEGVSTESSLAFLGELHEKAEEDKNFKFVSDQKLFSLGAQCNTNEVRPTPPPEETTSPPEQPI